MGTKRAIRTSRAVVSGSLRPAAILIEGDMITDIVEPGRVPSDFGVDDVGDAVVMPGLIDVHVHINEPGRTEWEGFETATKAACAGGITTVVDMPLNSSPVTTDVVAFGEKRAAAEGKLWVDCGFYAGLVPGNEGEIEALLDAGALGVKAFLCHSGIDEFPNATEKELRAVMPLLARRKKPLLVHAELVDGVEKVPHEHRRNYDAYSASRPHRWEIRALKLLIDLCRQTGCQVHIVHLATARAVPLLRSARAEGLPITVETGPHYLYFATEEIPDGDPRYKCAPPIRNSKNRRGLWEALQEGVIDLVATDHSPSPPELKELDSGDLIKAWGGISSLQLLLPVLWTAARSRGLSPVDIARWVCHEPARFLGVDHDRGELAVGKQANLVVWDPKKSFRVDPALLYHRHPISPYSGQSLYGVVEKTYLRGVEVFDGSKVIAEPQGRALISTKDPLKNAIKTEAI